MEAASRSAHDPPGRAAACRRCLAGAGARLHAPDLVEAEVVQRHAGLVHGGHVHGRGVLQPHRQALRASQPVGALLARAAGVGGARPAPAAVWQSQKPASRGSALPGLLRRRLWRTGGPCASTRACLSKPAQPVGTQRRIILSLPPSMNCARYSSTPFSLRHCTVPARSPASRAVTSDVRPTAAPPPRSPDSAEAAGRTLELVCCSLDIVFPGLEETHQGGPLMAAWLHGRGRSQRERGLRSAASCHSRAHHDGLGQHHITPGELLLRARQLLSHTVRQPEESVHWPGSSSQWLLLLQDVGAWTGAAAPSQTVRAGGAGAPAGPGRAPRQPASAAGASAIRQAAGRWPTALRRPLLCAACSPPALPSPSEIFHRSPVRQSSRAARWPSQPLIGASAGAARLGPKHGLSRSGPRHTGARPRRTQAPSSLSWSAVLLILQSHAPAASGMHGQQSRSKRGGHTAAPPSRAGPQQRRLGGGEAGAALRCHGCASVQPPWQPHNGTVQGLAATPCPCRRGAAAWASGPAWPQAPPPAAAAVAPRAAPA